MVCTRLETQEQIPGQEGAFRRKIIGVAQVINKLEGAFTPADVEIFEGLARQAAIAIDRDRLYQYISEVLAQVLAVMSKMIEAKDPYTEGHTQRVTTTSVAIAEEMARSETEVMRIRRAAQLHDIGKIWLDDSILHKKGRVSEREMAEIRRHPELGKTVLSPLYPFQQVIRGIAEHHESYDGKGYPAGLKGEEICLDARIIAVADTFDAMTSTRSYREALPTGVALEELQKKAGHQFDPRVVEAFLRAWEKGLVPVQQIDDELIELAGRNSTLESDSAPPGSQEHDHRQEGESQSALAAAR
jgi:HD-GYP domain-containing protein (c-di-GMP phosphodiesterase class II)